MAWLKLIYYHVIYWIVGTTPEAHHANLANTWYELDRYQNCIKHCKQYLSYEDSDHVKAVMAYCHGALGNWDEAAAVYRSTSKLWSEPMFALGLAEAELRRGNADEARTIVASIEAGDPNPKHDVALSLERLHGELASEATTD